MNENIIITGNTIKWIYQDIEIERRGHSEKRLISKTEETEKVFFFFPHIIETYNSVLCE
jgi:hypothetical protein